MRPDIGSNNIACLATRCFTLSMTALWRYPAAKPAAHLINTLVTFDQAADPQAAVSCLIVPVNQLD